MNPHDHDEDPMAVLQELWREHRDAPFPARLRGRDVDGIDFVLLDSDIASCVEAFLTRGDLTVFATATLGLRYQDAACVVPVLYEEGAAYFWRLQRLAELALREVRRRNHP